MPKNGGTSDSFLTRVPSEDNLRKTAARVGESRIEKLIADREKK